MIRHVLGITREGLINKYPLNLILAGILINGITGRVGLYPRVAALPGGLKIFVNNPATISINIPDQFVRGEYSLHRDFIPRRGFTVLDIGAYVGIYSLWASRLVGNEGLVIAFEPNPLAYQWLVKNIKLNEARNIHTIPYALGESLKVAELLIASDNIEASSFIDRKPHNQKPHR